MTNTTFYSMTNMSNEHILNQVNIDKCKRHDVNVDIDTGKLPEAIRYPYALCAYALSIRVYIAMIVCYVRAKKKQAKYQ